MVGVKLLDKLGRVLRYKLSYQYVSVCVASFVLLAKPFYCTEIHRRL